MSTTHPSPEALAVAEKVLFPPQASTLMRGYLQDAVPRVSAEVQKWMTEVGDLETEIDEAWDAFGTAGNRNALTLAEQISSHIREMDGLADRAAELERRAWPADLSGELHWILGRPNFWCARFAHLFQRNGHDIAKKAEDEQAFVLHWMVGLLFEHGPEKWRDAAEAKLKELSAALEQKETRVD